MGDVMIVTLPGKIQEITLDLGFSPVAQDVHQGQDMIYTFNVQTGDMLGVCTQALHNAACESDSGNARAYNTGEETDEGDEIYDLSKTDQGVIVWTEVRKP